MNASRWHPSARCPIFDPICQDFANSSLGIFYTTVSQSSWTGDASRQYLTSAPAEIPRAGDGNMRRYNDMECYSRFYKEVPAPDADDFPHQRSGKQHFSCFTDGRMPDLMPWLSLVTKDTPSVLYAGPDDGRFPWNLGIVLSAREDASLWKALIYAMDSFGLRNESHPRTPRLCASYDDGLSVQEANCSVTNDRDVASFMCGGSTPCEAASYLRYVHDYAVFIANNQAVIADMLSHPDASHSEYRATVVPCDSVRGVMWDTRWSEHHGAMNLQQNSVDICLFLRDMMVAGGCAPPNFELWHYKYDGRPYSSLTRDGTVDLSCWEWWNYPRHPPSAPPPSAPPPSAPPPSAPPLSSLPLSSLPEAQAAAILVALALASAALLPLLRRCRHHGGRCLAFCAAPFPTFRPKLTSLELVVPVIRRDSSRSHGDGKFQMQEMDDWEMPSVLCRALPNLPTKAN